jgi:hypothetical protein
MSETSRSLWQLLLLTRDTDKPAQLTCEECFVLLEYDAELLTSGANLNEIRPAISRHLSRCSGCKAKIDSWLGKLGGDGNLHIPFYHERRT